MEEQPIKVLAVVNGLGIGGTERMLERMVLRLSLSGEVRFTVCSLEDEGTIGGRLRSKGIEVIALDGRGRPLSIILGGLRGIRRLLKERQFDLIHSFLYRSHCAARLARLGLRQRVPLISSERCLGDNRSHVALMVNRVTSRLSDRILAVSQAVRDRVIARDCVSPAKIVTVLNGIEPSHPNPAAGARLRRTLGLPPHDVVFLVLGRLHREKGVDVFLEALRRLASTGVEHWHALVVGDGPAREDLEEAVENFGLRGRVLFAGSRRRVDPWIDACDILVLPSREEGMPVVALEAMAKGKPIIATRVGGTPEVVRADETGLLVPPEDPSALAAALSDLTHDASRRREIGRRGCETVRSHYSIDRMSKEILAIYQDLLGHFDQNARTRRNGVFLKASNE